MQLLAAFFCKKIAATNYQETGEYRGAPKGIYLLVRPALNSRAKLSKKI